MTEKESLKVLDEIITTLKLAGYDPYVQLEGYIETGSDVYITRSNNAREKIKFLELDFINKELRRHRNEY